MKRILLLSALAVVMVLAVRSAHHQPSPPNGTLQNYAQAATQGLPPGVDCMIGTITPDGRATWYKAGPGGTLTVPNGTSHPYVAKCINGAITAQPGSGDMPS